VIARTDRIAFGEASKVVLLVISTASPTANGWPSL
jgi:hypothetical protein